MDINERGVADAYADWQPYNGEPADEAVVCFGDIVPLVELADDHSVFPVSLAAYDVGMRRIVLMWCVTSDLWLQLWDGELADLVTVEDGTGRDAVGRLYASIAEIADRQCRAIRQSPRLSALREAHAAFETAQRGTSTDAVEVTAARLSDAAAALLNVFGS